MQLPSVTKVTIILLSIFSMLYFSFLWLIHFITESLYLFIPFTNFQINKLLTNLSNILWNLSESDKDLQAVVLRVQKSVSDGDTGLNETEVLMFEVWKKCGEKIWSLAVLPNIFHVMAHLENTNICTAHWVKWRGLLITQPDGLWLLELRDYVSTPVLSLPHSSWEVVQWSKISQWSKGCGAYLIMT